PPHPLERRRAVVFEEHNSDREIGGGVEAVRASRGANATMIVDHPVADQADAALGTAGQRLISGLRIDDGQIAAAQPCVVSLPVAVTMRATVSESLQHAQPDLRIERAMSRNQTRHMCPLFRSEE